MANLAIRNRLTVGNVWQGGAVALFNPNYTGALLDLGNVTDSAFDRIGGDRFPHRARHRDADHRGAPNQTPRTAHHYQGLITGSWPRSTSPCSAPANHLHPGIGHRLTTKTLPLSAWHAGTKSLASKSPMSS